MLPLESSILLTLLWTSTVTNGYGFREIGEECEPRRIKYLEEYSPSKSYVFSKTKQPYNTNFNYQNTFDQDYNVTEVEDRKCRSERGLYCDRWTRKCKCHDHSGSVYNYERGLCVLSIDHFCTTKTIDHSFANQHGGLEFEHICPEDSQCTCNYHLDRRKWEECQEENGLCKCKYLYSPTDDKRGCYYSRSSGISSLSAGIILLWFSSVLVT